MADTIKWAKAVVGVVSSLTLAALLVLDFWFTGRNLNAEAVYILLTIIGGTLGIDLITENIPVQVTITGGEGDDNDSGEG